MTHAAFKNLWTGRKTPGFQGHTAKWKEIRGIAGQCVDLVRFYLSEVLDVSQPSARDAYLWADPTLEGLEFIKNEVNTIPHEGDVAVFGRSVSGDGYGHVGIVDGYAAKQDFHSLDQNWPVGSPVSVVKHAYTNVEGFLRKKEASA